jgi:acetyltransferase-like isoleucine patch superfamily enzyme
MPKYEVVKDLFKGINIWKTIYTNFAYLPLGLAIKFPIIIYGNVVMKCSGKNNIIFNPKSVSIKFGILKIGKQVLLSQPKNTPTFFHINGQLSINGRVNIGKGCAIEVGNNAVLALGNQLSITGDTHICCTQNITIGHDCTISWDCLIMDTNWHSIICTKTGYKYPIQKPIIIGNNVWIGCQCTILKGTELADNTIVASNSKVSKAMLEKNVLVGSNCILKRDVTWER